MGVKYQAVAELQTKDDRIIVLRFHNLTFTQAKAFQKTFDQFDHIHSDADLTFHGWSEVKSGWDALEVEIIEKDEIFSD